MSRLMAAAALEWRVQWRYRIAAVALVITGAWTAALVVLPGWAAPGVATSVLLVDTATFGAFFIAALYLFERGEGALAALSVSPVRFGEYLGVKVGWLTVLSLGSALPIAVAAGAPIRGLGLVLTGVALIALLFLALNFALVVTHRSLTEFLLTAPIPLVPLMVVPLVHFAGLVDHPALYVVPTTGAVDVLRAGVDPAASIAGWHVVLACAYLVGWVVGALVLARWRFYREFTRPALGVRTNVHSLPFPRSSGWITALARIDARTIARSWLLLIVLAGPILLAVALRFGYPPLADYVFGRFDIALAPYRPLLLAALVVLHTPVILGMVGSLLVLDDIDDRKLLILRVSPVTLSRYLRYRAVSASLVALAGLVVAVPLSGLAVWDDLPAMLPALVLAAAQAPLVVLAVAAFAGNKVEGLGMLKLIGALFTAIAPVLWWVPAPVGWIVWVVPGALVAESLWRPSVLASTLCALLTAALAWLLARRTSVRLTG